MWDPTKNTLQMYLYGLVTTFPCCVVLYKRPDNGLVN